ncbi:MAG: alpha/beta fold hydrolase [Actinobacteria bacterium]|nr:alpha/beta fold hydrolase [Actinomycetota bacterium]
MKTEVLGRGVPVMFVHGALTNGPVSWSKQKPLGERWRLIVLNRPGFAPNPPVKRSDFDSDARAVAALLREEAPAHLVGHSYGGLIALLAASRAPEAVLSLTVIEPPVFSLMRGDADIEASLAGHAALVATHDGDLRAFLTAFTASLGGNASSVPNPLPPDLVQHAQLLLDERLPSEATIPAATLAKAAWPKLVVSGGHSAMHARMCDTLAAALEPRVQRAVLTGRGHSVQRLGEPFNELLEKFMLAATPSPA